MIQCNAITDNCCLPNNYAQTVINKEATSDNGAGVNFDTEANPDAEVDPDADMDPDAEADSDARFT